tara:strand:- start:136 stop:612 length:477 start_codon:yes stop_codon:yes gene_type:complete
MTLLNLKKNEPSNFHNEIKRMTKEPEHLNYYKNKNFSSNSQNSLIIGQGVKITGSIIAENEVIIQGTIDGDIDCNHVTINKGGIVKGKIKTENMNVEGRIEGELNINSILHIKKEGKVSGKIEYGTIQIDEGGRLLGDINSNEKSLESKNKEGEWKAL